jgi:hypothetical protein
MSLVHGRRLTTKQRKFLWAVRDLGGTLEEVIARQAINSPLFARWMRRSRFREAARAILREVDRKGRVWFPLELRRAREVISAALKGDPAVTDTQAMAALWFLQIALEHRVARKRGGKPRRAGAAATGAATGAAGQQPTPYHPSLTPAQARQLVAAWRARTAALRPEQK